jgi:hypothetical protein
MINLYKNIYACSNLKLGMHAHTLNTYMHTHIMFIRLHEIAHMFTYDLILVWQQINCSKFNMSRKIIIFGRMLPFSE